MRGGMDISEDGTKNETKMGVANAIRGESAGRIRQCQALEALSKVSLVIPVWESPVSDDKCQRLIPL